MLATYRMDQDRECFVKEMVVMQAVRDSSVWIAKVIFEWALAIVGLFTALAVGSAMGLPFVVLNGFDMILRAFTAFALWHVLFACICGAKKHSGTRASITSHAFLHCFINFLGLAFGQYGYAAAVPEALRNLFGLLPPVLFVKMFSDFADADLWGFAVTSANQDSHTEVWPLAAIMNWAVFDIFLYSVVLWYVDATNPTVYGPRRKWYFLFTESYWMSKNTDKASVDPLTNADGVNLGLLEALEDDDVRLEKESIRKDVSSPVKGANLQGITIANLFVVHPTGFGVERKRIIGVDHINAACEKGKCTVIWGDAKSGKSSIFGAVAGLTPIEDGTVLFNGLSVFMHSDGLKSSIGYCPSFNCFYPNLPIEECLRIIGGFRKLDRIAIKEQTEHLLKLFFLWEDRFRSPAEVNYYTRRKLVLAQTFIGQPAILVLDDPLNGLSMRQRREMWPVLKQLIVDRTVLMLTSFPEDATYLANKFLILKENKIFFTGSLARLKLRYAGSYIIRIDLHPDCACQGEIVEQILDVLPETELLRVSALMIKLRLSKNFLQHAPTMFANLETNAGRLRIKRMVCNNQTIQEICMPSENID
eukprot:ANDGO_02551.mRNA.1 ABC transporter A family member 2